MRTTRDVWDSADSLVLQLVTDVYVFLVSDMPTGRVVREQCQADGARTIVYAMSPTTWATACDRVLKLTGREHDPRFQVRRVPSLGGALQIPVERRPPSAAAGGDTPFAVHTNWKIGL